jgi:hypothetical protein
MFDEDTKVIPKGAQRKFSAQKSFLRECRTKSLTKIQKLFPMEHSVCFLLKSRSKGNGEPNTAEIEGEEVQKSFLRGCRTYTTKIEGEEAQKSFLRGCRA